MFINPDKNNSSILKPHRWNRKCKKKLPQVTQKKTIAFNNKWHNLNNLDECVQNKFLNVETAKLHVKNLLEKWVGLGARYLKILLLFSSFMFVCLFFSLLFCYFIDFLAVFHCREEFCEKSVSEDF